MQQKHFLLLFLPFLFLACGQQSGTKSALNEADAKKIVLVGGTLISTMEEYPFFEVALSHHFRKQDFSLRNIGWPADDVFGLARSQFGSAQNTQSWAPPTKEEGFGSKVLMEHIEEVEPQVLFVGYGPETAYFITEGQFELFQTGYEQLVKFADSIATKLILITPPKQELRKGREDEVLKRNQQLERTSLYISNLAEQLGLQTIDLYGHLVVDPATSIYTRNGVQLNEKGYQKMNAIFCEALGIKANHHFEIELTEEESSSITTNCSISTIKKTLNGLKFTLTPDHLSPYGTLIIPDAAAIYVNGEIQQETLDNDHAIILKHDSIRHQRLIETIKEKNRLYRYRLRPLNEAYIYLFRKHEMGHLAYEMDDLLVLVNEKEEEIKSMLESFDYYVEVEFIKPWNPPKTYADDEVPNFIPEPNVEEELASFQVAEELEISLFAKDPMFANPININWDTRGRAWVATSSIYPHIVPGREPNDKIVILEDTDGDGVADKHTIFAENLLVPHSVMPVKGGAYVTATTQLLFLEDIDGDDKADKTHVILDGFGNADIHHTIHGLRWTPWGDLHFTQSIYINTFLETENGTQVLNGSGVWSFRPENQSLKVFSRGLVNPWGEAFDQWGNAFATDGAGSSGISYIFPESAHATAVGTSAILENKTRGTPKNTGCEIIYSSLFPESWQGTAVTNDFRANRTVRYVLHPEDSGFRSEEVQTVLRSEHRSYRPVDSKIGPDGALYIVDWYNPIVDHGEVDFHHPIRDKTHGRIWRVLGKNKVPLSNVNFQAMQTSALLSMLKSTNQVQRQMANRSLVERSISANEVVSWVQKLDRSSIRFNQSFLEGLWLLASLDAYDEQLLKEGLNSSDHRVRAASVRLVANYKKQAMFEKEMETSIADRYPQVRLETLHALREMGGSEAAKLASKVMDMPMDENIEFALTTTLAALHSSWVIDYRKDQGLFGSDPNVAMFALLTIEAEENLPFIDQLMANPKISREMKNRARKMLAKIGGPTLKSDVLLYATDTIDKAILRIMANAPEEYDAIPDDLNPLEQLIMHDSMDIRMLGIELAGRWKAQAFKERILSIAIGETKIDEKIVAFEALESMDAMEEVIKNATFNEDEQTRAAALSTWLKNDIHAASSPAVAFLQISNDLEASEVVFTAFRRQEEGPTILEKNLQGKELSESVASAGLNIMQTSGLDLRSLEKSLREAGSIKALGLELTAEEKTDLIEDAKEAGATYRGRLIYRRKEMMCGSCHQVDKEGGLSGPYLGKIGTFMSPESILESLIDPSATIKQNYETVLVTRKDGEVINGILHRKTTNSTMIRQANSQVVEIPNSEISHTDVSPNSLMPPGLTRNLHRDELRDLLAYLMNLGVEE